MNVIIKPGKLQGTIQVPVSKSEMHRYLILGILSNTAEGIVYSELNDDTKATCDGVLRLRDHIYHKTSPVIDCNSSGTTLRLLLPIAAALGGEFTFKMSEQLFKRPIDELLRVMEDHGVKVSKDDCIIKISGKLIPGVYEVPGNISSQYISGLLMALMLLNGTSKLKVTGGIESKGYIDITLDILEKYHILITGSFGNWIIQGCQIPGDTKFKPSGDWSAAANFIAANAIGNNIKVLGLNSNSKQPDKAIYECLKRIGKEINVAECPDIAPVVAVAACGFNKETVITGIERLKLKESDRVASTIELINALGGFAEEKYGNLYIHGKGYLNGGVIDPHNDHRIAMAAAIASTICQNPVTVLDAECINKSYPNFWRDFKGVQTDRNSITIED